MVPLARAQSIWTPITLEHYHAILRWCATACTRPRVRNEQAGPSGSGDRKGCNLWRGSRGRALSSLVAVCRRYFWGDMGLTNTPSPGSFSFPPSPPSPPPPPPSNASRYACTTNGTARLAPSPVKYGTAGGRVEICMGHMYNSTGIGRPHLVDAALLPPATQQPSCLPFASLRFLDLGPLQRSTGQACAPEPSAMLRLRYHWAHIPQRTQLPLQRPQPRVLLQET